jgi:Transcriptional regulator
MDTRQLEYFTTIAAELNVTEAAHRLFVAQSTVSAGLRSLERGLGVQLFERTTKSVRLTDAGAELLPHAQEILDQVESLRMLAGQADGGLRGRLQLGIFVGLEQIGHLPAVLRELRDRFPGVEVSLAASGSGSLGLSEDLSHGRLDAAFVAVPPPPDLDAVELLRADYVAALPPGHRLSAQPAVSLADLAGEPWVEVPAGYGNRIQLEAALTSRGLSRRIVAEVPGLPAAAGYVAAGLGVAVIPKVVDFDGCAVRPLTEKLPAWRLHIATRKGSSRRPVLQALVQLFGEHNRGD